MFSQIIPDCNQRFQGDLATFRHLHPTLTLITIRQPDNRTTERIVSAEKTAAKPCVMRGCRQPREVLFCRAVPRKIRQRILFLAKLRIPVPAGSRKLWKSRPLPATRPVRKFPRPDKRTSSRTLRYKFSSLPSPPRRYGAFGVQSETYAIS